MAAGDASGRDSDAHMTDDRMRTGRPGPRDRGLTGTVVTVEYHGQRVQVALAVPGLDDLTVQLPETEFFAAPLRVGESVPVTWSVDDIHVLDDRNGGPAA